MKNNKRAFTLIELLTVIAIIGILAGIIVPTVGAVRENATKSKTRAMYSQWITALEQFRQDYGYIPIFTFPQAENGDFVQALSGTGGDINTRNIRYYSFPEDAIDEDSGNVVDAFGNPNIGMARDENRDGQIPVGEFSSLPASDQPSSPVRSSVVFWSIPNNNDGFPVVKSWN